MNDSYKKVYRACHPITKHSSSHFFYELLHSLKDNALLEPGNEYLATSITVTRA